MTWARKNKGRKSKGNAHFLSHETGRTCPTGPRTDAKKPRQAEAQRGEHTHRLTEKSAHRRRQ